MTRQLSHNTEMARRVLAMTIGLPINSDPGLREDTFCLVGISDILDAAHCFADVEREMRETDVLNIGCHPSLRECVESLRWVLDVTGNPAQVLYVLCGDCASYHLIPSRGAGDIFDDGRLHFFEEHCRRKLSIRKRLVLAAEAVELGERWSRARLDMWGFAKRLLADINFLTGCPAYHRRNLVCGGLEFLMERDANTADVQTVPPLCNSKNIIFCIQDLIRPSQG